MDTNDTQRLGPDEEPGMASAKEPNMVPVVTPAGDTVVATPMNVSGESVAEQYINDELRTARTTLQRTRLFGSLMALAVVIYLGYITATFYRSLQPEDAAEITSGLISERVETQGQEIADQVKTKVPQLIAGLPDYALKEMPNQRKALEDRIDADLAGYCHENADELGKQLDDFLNIHKADIKDMLVAGQEKENMGKIGDELEQQFVTFLQTKPSDGSASVQQKINQSLVALKEVEKKLSRLASGKNLTPAEKKARRAIAIISTQVNMQMGMPVGTTTIKAPGKAMPGRTAMMTKPGSKPMAAKPMAAKPMAAKPMAAKPMAAKPMAAKPMAAKPMAAKPPIMPKPATH